MLSGRMTKSFKVDDFMSGDEYDGIFPEGVVDTADNPLKKCPITIPKNRDADTILGCPCVDDPKSSTHKCPECMCRLNCDNSVHHAYLCSKVPKCPGCETRLDYMTFHKLNCPYGLDPIKKQEFNESPELEEVD